VVGAGPAGFGREAQAAIEAAAVAISTRRRAVLPVVDFTDCVSFDAAPSAELWRGRG